MTSFDQFVCLTGLPRTGSTLLSAILSQNPAIHAEGNSAVCQLMWDLHSSGSDKCGEQLMANNRQSTLDDLVSSIPHIYYKNNEPQQRIVVDKCRSWTLPSNIRLVERYITPNVKMIIMERPVPEIVKSFERLYKKNNQEVDIAKFTEPESEPIMRSLLGVDWVKACTHDNNFLFVQYKDLISEPEETLRKIYEFCEWEEFTHDFENIEIKYPENDAVYGLLHQHSVYNKIIKDTSTMEDNIVIQDITPDTIMDIQDISGVIVESGVVVDISGVIVESDTVVESTKSSKVKPDKGAKSKVKTGKNKNGKK